MRISDWSSDVCSSDLFGISERGAGADGTRDREREDDGRPRPIGPDPGERVDAGADDRADAQGDQVRPAQCLGETVPGVMMGHQVDRFAWSEHMPPLFSLCCRRALGLDRRVSAPLRRSIGLRSEEHTSELQSLMRISYAVFCLKKKKNHQE